MMAQLRTLPRIKPLIMSALPVNNEVAGMLLAKITPPGSRIFKSNVNFRQFKTYGNSIIMSFKI